MIHIFVEPNYGIVEFKTQLNSEIVEFITNSERRSLLDPNVFCKVISFNEKDIPLDLLNDLLMNPTRFIYDLNFKGFKIRPFLTVESSTQEAYVGENVLIKIKYNDPDNVGFNKLFSYVKVKDRKELINLHDEIKLDQNGEATLTITSNYPGKVEIIAKDDKYLCYYESVKIKFKPQ